jgi:hypothetical protein
MTALIFHLQLFAAFAMTGLIWFVQVVHYPLFHQSSRSPDFFRSHADRTGFVVVPLMLVEMATAVVLLFPCAGELPRPLALANFILLALSWFATAVFSVPCHRRLVDRAYDPDTVDRLVHTNWIRTVLWTIRSILLLGALGAAGPEFRAP